MTNRDGRFEAHSRETVDDGWDLDDGWAHDDGRLPPPRTEVTVERPRTILARNTSPDVPFDRSINPYRGCEHGCVYCFARPTHAYMGLSPGLDFETRLFAKPTAADLLRAELAKRGYACRPIQMGSNTDPYQPEERRLGITRDVLEVLAACDHPVSITTKSHLVCRDLDLLGPMAAKGLAAVGISVTTLDRDLARRLEPRAPTPARRLEAMARLADAGVPVAVMVAPVIPALTDHEVERILEAARDAGARTAAYILLRLPLELKDLVGEWLDAHAPDRKARVLNQMRASREGALYQTDWTTRRTGSGETAALLGRRFQVACRRLGLNGGCSADFRLRTDLFKRPAPRGDGRQLALF